jgi:hypothetical protein
MELTANILHAVSIRDVQLAQNIRIQVQQVSHFGGRHQGGSHEICAQLAAHTCTTRALLCVANKDAHDVCIVLQLMHLVAT